MYSTISIFMLGLIIPSLLLIISVTASRHTLKDREKMSPFECGFDPMSTARIPFSMRFFLLAVIFLVFDIEIVLLMPMILLPPNNISQLGALLFLLILMIGLLHEWNEGSLDWS